MSDWARTPTTDQRKPRGAGACLPQWRRSPRFSRSTLVGAQPTLQLVENIYTMSITQKGDKLSCGDEPSAVGKLDETQIAGLRNRVDAVHRTQFRASSLQVNSNRFDRAI